MTQSRRGTPVLTEALVGWRVWCLHEKPGEGFRLLPAGLGQGSWPAQRAFEARCRSSYGRDNSHAAPRLACSCGIYASDTLSSLMSAGTMPTAAVVGQVSLWGKVIEHRSGWRAQRAYPARLRLICGACLAERRGIGTPQVVVRNGDGLATACAEHDVHVPDTDDVYEPAVVEAAILDAYAVDLLPAEALGPTFALPPYRTRITWGEAMVELRALAYEGADPDGLPLPHVAMPPIMPFGGMPFSTSGPPVLGSPSRAVTAGSAPGSASATVPLAAVPPATVARPPHRRLLRQVGAAIGRLVLGVVQLAFTALFLYVGCASAFTIVEVPLPARQSVPRPTGQPPTDVPRVVVTMIATEARARYDVATRVSVSAVPDFEFVCGRVHGGRVEYVVCDAQADVWGVAQRPPGHRCTPNTTAATRRPTYSVCWFAPDPKTRLPPVVGAADPFREEVP